MDSNLESATKTTVKMGAQEPPSRALAYLFLFNSLVAFAVALFFGYYGVQLAYLAGTFERKGSLTHAGMYLAGVLFPFVALTAAAIGWLCWKAGRRLLNVRGAISYRGQSTIPIRGADRAA